MEQALDPIVAFQNLLERTGQVAGECESYDVACVLGALVYACYKRTGYPTLLAGSM